MADGIQQVFGQSAALEDRPHEGEERNGKQQVVGDDAIELIGEIAEKIGTNEPDLDPDEAEEQADRRERKRRGIADQHEDDEPSEHQGRHILPNEIDHCSGFSYSYCSR